MNPYYYLKSDGSKAAAAEMFTHEKKKGADIVVNCGNGGDAAEELSAFRAVNNTDQPYEVADEFVKVLFQAEQFDIGNVYNANTSTFVPVEEGVYYVAGTVTFIPSDTTTSYRIRLEIRVNGESVAADNDFFSGISAPGIFVNAINTSTILLLQAGALVEIFLTSTIPGTIFTDQPGFSTRFEAAQF